MRKTHTDTPVQITKRKEKYHSRSGQTNQREVSLANKNEKMIHFMLLRQERTFGTPKLSELYST